MEISQYLVIASCASVLIGMSKGGLALGGHDVCALAFFGDVTLEGRRSFVARLHHFRCC